MTKDGIEKIQEMTRVGVHKASNGREIAFGSWSYVEPYRHNPIEVSTLQGLCDCVNSLYNMEAEVIVASAFQVVAYGPVDATTKKRPELVVASTDCSDTQAVLENSWPISTFIRRFKKGFYFQEADAPVMLEFLSQISMDHLTEMKDDGITQHVVVRQGVTSLTHKSLGESLQLRPKCMFAEVEMTLPYFLRLERDGEVILTKAYGESDLADVARGIQEYINDEVDKLVVI